MSHLGHHVRLRRRDSAVIADTPDKRLAATRVVLAMGRRFNLLTMFLADTHLHSQVRCGRRGAGAFAHAVESSLKQRLGLRVGFVQYEPEPIRDQRHAYNTARYILTQHQRHGLADDDTIAASNAPDLLGQRVIGGYSWDNVQRWLPRLDRATILRWLGWPPLRPADEPLSLLVQAALAATGLHDLRGSCQAVLAARRAAVEIIGHRLSNREVAQLLQIGCRTVTWLRARPVDAELVRAVRLQLGHLADRAQAPKVVNRVY